MTRPHGPKVTSHPDSSRGGRMGVVRMTRAIPDMAPAKNQADLIAAPRANICMGRCGHCEVHPCQLHVSV